MDIRVKTANTVHGAYVPDDVNDTGERLIAFAGHIDLADVKSFSSMPKSDVTNPHEMERADGVVPTTLTRQAEHRFVGNETMYPEAKFPHMARRNDESVESEFARCSSAVFR